MKKIKNKSGIIVILVFLTILILHYFYNYDLYKQPPSTLWSKEVKVGSGNVLNNPIFIKEQDRLLVAYDDEKKLQLSVTDLNGKSILNKTFNVDEEFIKDVLFLKSKDGYVLGYSSTKSSVGYLEKFILDKDLNLVKKENINGLNSTNQIDESNYTIGYNDKIELINTVSNKVQTVKATNVSMITGSKSANGFLVCYIEGQDSFKFFTTEGDKVNEPKVAANLNKADNVTYGQISCSTDGKNGYIVLEEHLKGEFNGAKGIEFSLDGSKSVNNPIYIGNSKMIRQNSGVYSQEGGKFYGVFGRTFGKKSYQENIISYTLKDGKTDNIQFVSRTREMCFLPYGEEDYVSFLTFNKPNDLNINIASTKDNFKEINNVPRAEEKTRAFSATMEGLMFSLAYVFVYGFKWILPVMLVAGTLAFFDYAYSEKTKLRGFIVLATFAIAVKTYGIIPVFYENYAGLLPDVIGSKLIGTIICSIIGIVSYYYVFLTYKRDTEDMGILKFLSGLLIDTVLTLMVFVPFIV